LREDVTWNLNIIELDDIYLITTMELDWLQRHIMMSHWHYQYVVEVDMISISLTHGNVGSMKNSYSLSIIDTEDIISGTYK